MKPLGVTIGFKGRLLTLCGWDGDIADPTTCTTVGFGDLGVGRSACRFYEDVVRKCEPWANDPFVVVMDDALNATNSQ